MVGGGRVIQVWTSLRELSGTIQALSCCRVTCLLTITAITGNNRGLLTCLSVFQVTQFTISQKATQSRFYATNTASYEPVIDTHTSDISGLEAFF